jgi:hypothetical protein
MADAPALIAKRYRQHKQGDHSLCVAGRCEALGGARKTGTAGRAQVGGEAAAVTPVVDGERLPGGIETAVVAFVASLPYQAPDPRALLAQIAVRLAQRVDETGALPAAVRELRVLLMQLTETPNGPSGVVDEVRLRAAQRKLDNILATAA